MSWQWQDTICQPGPTTVKCRGASWPHLSLKLQRRNTKLSVAVNALIHITWLALWQSANMFVSNRFWQKLYSVLFRRDMHLAQKMPRVDFKPVVFPSYIFAKVRLFLKKINELSQNCVKHGNKIFTPIQKFVYKML
jgi:hypothetical protein